MAWQLPSLPLLALPPVLGRQASAQPGICLFLAVGCRMLVRQLAPPPACLHPQTPVSMSAKRITSGFVGKAEAGDGHPPVSARSALIRRQSRACATKCLSLTRSGPTHRACAAGAPGNPNHSIKSTNSIYVRAATERAERLRYCRYCLATSCQTCRKWTTLRCTSGCATQACRSASRRHVPRHTTQPPSLGWGSPCPAQPFCGGGCTDGCLARRPATLSLGTPCLLEEDCHRT